MALESGPLSDPAFATFAQEVVPFLHVTSHVPGEPHPELLLEKGGTGFPHVVYLDGDGEVLAVQGLSRLDVASFLETTRSVEEFLKLRSRARAALGPLTEAQEQRFQALLLGLEVREAAQEDVSRSRALELGKQWAERARAGQFPEDEESYQLYCLYILEHAEAAGDPVLFTRMLEAMRARFGQLPGFEAGFWIPYQERLEKLRQRPPP